MKNLSFLLFCFIVSVTSFGQNLIIKNVNVISMTSDNVDRSQTVFIEDGLIKEITSTDKFSNKRGIEVIDAEGQYLMPGFADMHVHLPPKEYIDELLQMSIAAGITHIRLMKNSHGSQFELKAELDGNADRMAPMMHYSHLITRDLEKVTKEQMDSLILSVQAKGATFIKLISLSNEAVFDVLMASAKKNNIIVCGHYPIYKEDGKSKFVSVKKVLKSGFRSIEHLGAYVSIQSDSTLDMALEETIKNHVFNCPTFDFKTMVMHMQYPEEVMNRLTNRCLPKKFTEDWSEQYAMQIAEEGGEEKVLALREKRQVYFEKNKKILKRMADDNCLLIVGSDGGGPFQAPGFNLWEEMMEWSDLGIDNYTILQSATINGAKFFKQENQWGTVEVGKRADLILLDKNPLEDIENITSLQSTIIGGKQYFKKQILDFL